MGRDAGQEHGRLRGRRAQPAALHRHRHRVRDLVRLGNRARHSRDISARRPGRRDRRPVRLQHVPDPGRPLLRAAALPHAAADDRRLLPQQVRPHGRSADHAVHRAVLPGLGRRADLGAGPGLPRRVRRRDVAVDGHDRRRVDRADLHDVGRHVGGRDHRLPPDDHHRDRHALYRLGREPARRRRHGRGHARGGRRQVRDLLAGAHRSPASSASPRPRSR